jgi:hypothetical protein
MSFSSEWEIPESSYRSDVRNFLSDRRTADDKLKDFDVSLSVKLCGLQKANRQEDGSDRVQVWSRRGAMRGQAKCTAIGGGFAGVGVGKLSRRCPQHQQRAEHGETFYPTHVFLFQSNLQHVLVRGNVTRWVRAHFLLS